VLDLAQRRWLSQATLVAATKGTGVYAVPTDAVDVFAVAYDGDMLDEMTHTELEAISPYWRDARDRPVGFTVMGETDKQIRLYPVPNETSGDHSFPRGAPFGIDMPAYSIMMFHTEYRENLLPYLDLMAALMLLQMEFNRDSSHRDVEFAKACGEMVTLIEALII